MKFGVETKSKNVNIVADALFIYKAGLQNVIKKNLIL